MRRHAEVEHPKVIGERSGIDAPSGNGALQLVAPVKALAAGGDLQTAKEEIEALRRAVAAARPRVERAARERIAEHEHRRHAMLRFGEGTELALGLRVEIVGQIVAAMRAAQPLETLAELPDGRVEHRREERAGAPFEDIAVARVEPIENVREQLPLQCDQILRAVDESHLEI